MAHSSPSVMLYIILFHNGFEALNSWFIPLDVSVIAEYAF
jgi:hypothetical protein